MIFAHTLKLQVAGPFIFLEYPRELGSYQEFKWDVFSFEGIERMLFGYRELVTLKCQLSTLLKFSFKDWVNWYINWDEFSLGTHGYWIHYLMFGKCVHNTILEQWKTIDYCIGLNALSWVNCFESRNIKQRLDNFFLNILSYVPIINFAQIRYNVHMLSRVLILVWHKVPLMSVHVFKKLIFVHSYKSIGLFNSFSVFF